MWIWILLLLLLVAFWWIFFRKQKAINYGCILFITGANKTGKTLLSCDILQNEYARVIGKWKRYNLKQKIKAKLKKQEYTPSEMPLIYSNMPINCDYVPLEQDLLLRKKRFVKGSIVYLNEASFVASQQDYKDDEVNFNLQSFVKLFGHECGSPELNFDGLLIVDTQNMKDCHYAFKNCCSTFIYIHHKKSFFHFWVKLFLKEYSYIDKVENNETQDVPESFKEIILRKKKLYGFYDRFAYSSFSDDLPVVEKEIMPKNLKMKKIVSFNNQVANAFNLEKRKVVK